MLRDKAMSLSMGKALEGIDWDLLQLRYQRDGRNCREIAEEFKISINAVKQQCARHKWRKEKIELVTKVTQIVTEKLVDRKIKALGEREIAIQEHESKAFGVADMLIDGVRDSYQAMPDGLMDPAMLNGLASTLKTSVGVARLSLGALDPVQRQDLTSGGMSLHSNALAILASCRKLQVEGKLGETTDDIDVEGLLADQAESKRLESEQ